MRGSEFCATASLLLSIGFTEVSLGPRSSQLTSFLALLAILPFFATRLRHLRLGRPRDLFLLLTALLGFAIWFSTPDATRYFALAAAFAAISGFGGREEESAPPRVSSLATTAFGFAIFVVVRDHLSLWPVLNSFSQNATAAVSDFLGGRARLGPTYSGLSLVIAFAIASLSLTFASPRRRPTFLALALVFVLASPAILLALRLHAPWSLARIPVRPFVSSRVFLFLLLLLPLAILFLVHRSSEPSSGPPVKRARLFGALATGVALLGLLLLTWSSAAPRKPVRALLDTRGAFDLSPLEWGKYGPEASAGASLASLPLLLRAFGFELDTTDVDLDENLLDRHDVLVVVNPTHDYKGAERDAIWTFVARGGGLLVLGDHTNIQETLAPLNSLLEPSGLRFEFDSAIPLVPRWTWYSCMRAHPHPVVRGVRDETDVKTSVGASLALPRSALPILTGRDAFSDAGNWENSKGAYLGNMSYDAAEPLGDLFLAAEARYGGGKVIVFGDTSPFQRSAVFLSHELVLRTLVHLASKSSGALPFRIRALGALLLLMGALGVLLVSSRRSHDVFVFSGIAALWLLSLDHFSVIELPEGPPSARVARIDLAHGNRVDLHAGEDDGIGGLVDHLFRHGDLPLAMKDFDEDTLQDSKLFVTIAPAFAFGSAERAAVRRFVESGGLLIVASGYDERRGSEALLAEFGYSIGSTPIGAAHESRTHFEGLYVLMHEAWPVVSPENRGEVWVDCWGYPLVVFERIGPGGILVIGDSRFLCDVKLESAEAFVEANIDFLRRAIETARAPIESGA